MPCTIFCRLAKSFTNSDETVECVQHWYCHWIDKTTSHILRVYCTYIYNEFFPNTRVTYIKRRKHCRYFMSGNIHSYCCIQFIIHSQWAHCLYIGFLCVCALKLEREAIKLSSSFFFSRKKIKKVLNIIIHHLIQNEIYYFLLT